MIWNTLASWLKKKRQMLSSYNQLDQQLVKNTQGRLLPHWSQLKYIRHFLSSAEKRVALLGIVLIAIGVVGATAIWLSRHIVSAPKEGGEYSEAIVGQPKYVNPLFAGRNDVDADLVALVYAGLFRRAKDLTLTPDLAESYTVSDDKKTYIMTLRQNLRWSDGEPLTAEDVVYTFELIQNPEVGSPLLAAFQGVKAEKIDDRTVRFTLKEPFVPFLGSLTVGIIPEHIWSNSAPSAIRLAKSNLQPVGAGAWQFNKLLKGGAGKIDSFTLTRNQWYHGDKPYIKTLTFKFFDDYQGASEALRAQTVNALNFVPRPIQNKLTGKSLLSYHLQLPQYTALFFNQATENLLKEDALRLALAQAIDKKRLVTEALDGLGEVIEGPILPGSTGFNSATKPLGVDLAAANALLDKTWLRLEPEGYFKLRYDTLFKNYQAELETFKKANSSTPDKITAREQAINKQLTSAVRQEMAADQTFYRRNKDGRLLELAVTTVDAPEYTKVAELIVAMWRDLGIRATVVAIDSRQIVRDILKNRSYQVLLYGEIIGYINPDPFPFWHSSQAEYPGLNVAVFTNRNADKTLESVRSEQNETKRIDAYVKFQEILAKEIPAVFLFSPRHTFMVTSNVQGIEDARLETPSDRFNDLSHWYIKTKWQWK
ncbi:MAG: peptide ABC transporter substrate-binding protein [Candidatus Magasanikbacteria bacterium]|nr:peptide ABC transporter substrate-binding protein [Candidatus Magasanikbacteria bacterium]